MKMQYHKIRNVEKSICTAEQMIAYNIASDYIKSDFEYLFEKVKKQYPQLELEAEEIITSCGMDLIHKWISYYKKHYSNTKYNIDAIQCCLNAGLREYLLHPQIFTSYEAVGKAFPAHYL